MTNTFESLSLLFLSMTRDFPCRAEGGHNGFVFVTSRKTLARRHGAPTERHGRRRREASRSVGARRLLGQYGRDRLGPLDQLSQLGSCPRRVFVGQGAIELGPRRLPEILDEKIEVGREHLGAHQSVLEGADLRAEDRTRALRVVCLEQQPRGHLTSSLHHRSCLSWKEMAAQANPPGFGLASRNR